MQVGALDARMDASSNDLDASSFDCSGMLVLLNIDNGFDVLRRVRFIDSIKQRENACSILAFTNLKGMTIRVKPR